MHILFTITYQRSVCRLSIRQPAVHTITRSFDFWNTPHISLSNHTQIFASSLKNVLCIHNTHTYEGRVGWCKPNNTIETTANDALERGRMWPTEGFCAVVCGELRSLALIIVEQTDLWRLHRERV